MTTMLVTKPKEPPTRAGRLLAVFTITMTMRLFFFMSLLSAALFSAACSGNDGDSWNSDSYQAPDFALIDVNPDSPTYEQERRLSDARGKVVVLYFASYG